jgi:hypothetical protein
MTFARYSPKPLIANVNPAYDGELETLEFELGQRTCEIGDNIYEIEWSNGTPSIKSMSVKNSIHLLTLDFSPSFPCLNAISANTNLKGSFRISGHESVGFVSGEYHIQSKDKSMAIRLIPSNGWQPKTNKFSTCFLFSVAKVFKKWPTTYRWDAELNNNLHGGWYMQSKWIRTGKILKY